MAEAYTGTKFETKFLGKFVPNDEQKVLIEKLVAVGKDFVELSLIDANGGNFSVRWDKGFMIKQTGIQPDQMKARDFVYVKKADGKTVQILGAREPSSETRLHYLVYQARSDVSCILHAHDKVVVNSKKRFSEVAYMPYMPYGTLEVALEVSELAKKHDFVVIAEHGVFSFGKDVDDALAKIKKYHEKAS